MEVLRFNKQEGENMTLDVIIHGGYVLTMEGPGSGMIPNGAVAIRGDSIVAVGPAPEILKQYSAHRYVDAHDHAVLPVIFIRLMQSCEEAARISQNGCTVVSFRFSVWLKQRIWLPVLC